MRALRRCIGVAVMAAGLVGLPASAAIFSYDNSGVALPSAACPPPPALPLGCDVTALGNAVVTAGDAYGPWNFLSVFQIGAPLSATTFAVTGTFAFDDPSPANDDFFGTVNGIIDVVTFSTAMNSVVTGGLGAFLNASGWGASLVTITLHPDGPPTYLERGRFTISEPGSFVLLLVALAAALPLSRRMR